MKNINGENKGTTASTINHLKKDIRRKLPVYYLNRFHGFKENCEVPSVNT